MKTDPPTPNLDPDQLRLTDPRALKPKPSSRPRPKAGKRFLKGPIPWDWLCVALSLPGRAGAVGIAIWFWAGISRNRTVKLSYADLARMDVDRYAARRGLLALKKAGLVNVESQSGCAPVVTILDTPSVPTLCSSTGESDSRNVLASCKSTER